MDNHNYYKTVFTSAFVDVFAEENKEGKMEYYLRLNGKHAYQICEKQFIDLLEVSQVQNKFERSEL
jgi:dihydroorotase